MSESDPSALYVLAGSLITGILAFIIQFMNGRAAAQKDERAGKIEMDKVTLMGVTSAQQLMGEAQAAMQIQASRRDEDVRELRLELAQMKLELGEANKEIALLNRKLGEAERSGDPLKKEIDDLKKQVAELQETIGTLQKTIEGLQDTIDTLQATIEELRAQIPEQGSTGEK